MGRGIDLNTVNPYTHATRIVGAANNYVTNASLGTPTGRTTLTAVANGTASFAGAQQVLSELAQVSRTLGENIASCNTTIIVTDANQTREMW